MMIIKLVIYIVYMIQFFFNYVTYDSRFACKGQLQVLSVYLISSKSIQQFQRSFSKGVTDRQYIQTFSYIIILYNSLTKKNN